MTHICGGFFAVVVVGVSFVLLLFTLHARASLFFLLTCFFMFHLCKTVCIVVCSFFYVVVIVHCLSLHAAENVLSQKKKPDILTLCKQQRVSNDEWYRWCKCHPISIIIKLRWFLEFFSVEKLVVKIQFDRQVVASSTESESERRNRKKNSRSYIIRNGPKMLESYVIQRLCTSSSHTFYINRTILYCQILF